MAKQTINVGTTANDKKGDSLRAAFTKVNANFTELYTALGLNTDGTLNLGAFEFNGSTMSTTDSTPIVIDQSVTVSSDLTVGGDIVPSVANGGNLGSLAKPFKSLYVSNSTVFLGGVPLSLEAGTNTLKVNNVPISQNITYADIPSAPTDISDLTDNTGLLGSGTGDITFAASTISSGTNDEIVVQAKDADSFGTARLRLEPEYSTAELTAFSGENVNTFTIMNADFATGVWRNNGFGIGIVEFTGAQNIGDFFQNTLTSLTPDNVTISINGGTAFVWNGGTSGSGTATPGLNDTPTVPPSPVAITSISFRYRNQSYINVGYDFQEIRLNAENAGIRMDASNSIQMFGNSSIELQSGENFTINSGGNINLGTGSSDTTNISTGDFNITAFDDISIRGYDVFRLRNESSTAPIQIITDDDNTSQTWRFNVDGSLTIPGDIRSEREINIDINLTDSTLRRWRFGEDGELTFPDGTAQSTAFTGTGYLTFDDAAVRGTSDYQYTFNTDGYFLGSTSTENPNYFYVANNTTNQNIAAGWTVVGANCNTTVSSTEFPVAGYPGVIKVTLTAAASGTSGFYPVVVSDPNRLKVQIQPNPGNASKYTFTTSGLTFPDTTVQTTAFTGTVNYTNISGRPNQSLDTTSSVKFNSVQSNIVAPITTGANRYTITGITVETPFTNPYITVSGSLGGGFVVGERIEITGVTTPSQVNGFWYVDFRSSNSFRIYSDEARTVTPNASGWAAYTGSGIVKNIDSPAAFTITNNSNVLSFNTNGSLTFPDATVQTTAWTGTLTVNDSGLTINGGTGTIYQGPSGALQVGDKKGGVYHATSTSSNGLFTFGMNGSGIMSAAVEGSLFVGTSMPSNNGGVTTAFGGWLVVENGGKFGTDLDTLGNMIIGKGVFEKFQTKADATGTVEHDCINGHIFYHTSPDANWTANFTNLNIATGYATSITIVITQGGTGYYPNAVQIGGVGQTINWQGNATPTPSVNRTDVVTFSIINNAGTYIVLGQLTGF